MPQPEPPIAELSRLVREAQTGERIPSVSAAAIGNGEVVWQEALGLANVDGEQQATTDTQYRVGSITKTFTAAAIMQLRDAGELELDARGLVHEGRHMDRVHARPEEVVGIADQRVAARCGQNRQEQKCETFHGLER